MVYEFAVKIKNIRNNDMYDEENLNAGMADLIIRFGHSMDIKTMRDDHFGKDILIRAQASVSSYSTLHDTELEVTIDQFKIFIKEVEFLLKGEASTADAFYHNNKIFAKLYN
jgi:hypothetical protein